MPHANKNGQNGQNGQTEDERLLTSPAKLIPAPIDFTRTDHQHMGFAFGPHRCIGSHLARLELQIAFEETLARLSPFRIKEGTAPIVHAGGVWGADELHMAWG